MIYKENLFSNFFFQFYKPFSNLFLFFTVLVFMALVIVKGSDLIFYEIKNYEDNKKKIKDLEFKKEILSSISPKVLEKSNVVSIAIPEEKPILLAMSQIRSYIFKNQGIFVKSFSVGDEAKISDEINSLNFSIELKTESIQDIFDFVDNINKSSPIMSIQSLDAQVLGSEVKFKILLSVYWSKYPDKIDTLVSDFTSKENEILDFVTKLNQPQLIKNFLSPLPPAFVRQNPFN
ncbi:MAG: hypothetical protein N2558_01160 [Patescibacteria group bacterium]|nr:hypothetical protein [Patescibacteria group bacterium]